MGVFVRAFVSDCDELNEKAFSNGWRGCLTRNGLSWCKKDKCWLALLIIWSVLMFHLGIAVWMDLCDKLQPFDPGLFANNDQSQRLQSLHRPFSEIASACAQLFKTSSWCLFVVLKRIINALQGNVPYLKALHAPTQVFSVILAN